MYNSGYYTNDELHQLGLNCFGQDVLISRKASLYQTEKISLGSHIRIDDFCTLNGKITIGNYVHIGAFSGLYAGDAGITIEDFAGLSSRVTIYSISDDFSGEHLTNPCIPIQYRKLTKKPVLLEKHAIVGTGAVILPGVILAEGTAVGSMSLVTKSSEPWSVLFGTPAKKIKSRKKSLLRLEEEFLKSKTQ